MKRGLIHTILLLLTVVVSAQKLTPMQYENTFTIDRSAKDAFTMIDILAPCPQSNDYQDIDQLDYSSNGEWMQHTISENRNHYLEIVLSEDTLLELPQKFSVSYRFVLRPKTIAVDLSQFKEKSGRWKDLPDYNTSTADYRDNTKQSGDIVVPSNATIKKISDQLYSESYGSRLAYAEKCYEYVAANYKYLNPYTGIHPLTTILSWGGGDCGNLSTIYISLLRAKGIPARHVLAIKGTNDFHIWSEFLIQGFGWVPVDVTYKNSNFNGNYFGRYDYSMVVVQKGVNLSYPTLALGTRTIDMLQTYYWWYFYSRPANISIKQTINAYPEGQSSIDTPQSAPADATPKKVIINGRLYIRRGNRLWTIDGKSVI